MVWIQKLEQHNNINLPNPYKALHTVIIIIIIIIIIIRKESNLSLGVFKTRR
jgi:hypothetical protein